MSVGSWGEPRLQSLPLCARSLPPCPHFHWALTITHSPSILPMVTVVLAPGPCGAEPQGRLISQTPKIIQDDGARPLPKEGAPGSSQCRPATQLPAGHGGITQVPGIITH